MANFVSKNVVYGKAFANTLLAAYKTNPAAALVPTPKLRLSHDPAFNPTPDSTIAELAAQECEYNGYAAGGIAPTLSDPLNINPILQGVNAGAVFIMTLDAPIVTDICYGYWLDDGTDVVVAEAFADGFTAPFQVAGDFLDLQAFLPVNLLQPAE